jgi:UrcA family protein
MMTRFMIAAAAGLMIAGFASASMPNVFLSGSTVHIRYADLDLRSPTGRTMLQTRIRQGADLLCADANDDKLPTHMTRGDCYRIALASGRAQMGAIMGL